MELVSNVLSNNPWNVPALQRQDVGSHRPTKHHVSKHCYGKSLANWESVGMPLMRFCKALLQFPTHATVIQNKYFYICNDHWQCKKQAPQPWRNMYMDGIMQGRKCLPLILPFILAIIWLGHRMTYLLALMPKWQWFQLPQDIPPTAGGMDWMWCWKRCWKTLM